VFRRQGHAEQQVKSLLIWWNIRSPRRLTDRGSLTGQFMPDRSDEFRAAASECLRLARLTSDESTRASLLVMAQRWFELANGPPSQDTLDVAVRAFNERQMSPQPVMQQQQQIQPKKKE
jgi:hypothetical protein